MERKITITNPNLVEYLNFILDKSGNEFAVSELMSIEDLQIDTQDVLGEFFPVNLNILQYFVNLKSLELNNIAISELDFQRIANLKLHTLRFMNCSFETPEIISHLTLRSLSIVGGDIQNFEFLNRMSSLYNLELINVSNLDLKYLSKLKNLDRLVLTNSKLENVCAITLSKLKEMCIDYIQVDSLDNLGINNLNLNTLVVDKSQIDRFKSELLILQNKGIHILDSNYFSVDLRDNNESL